MPCIGGLTTGVLALGYPEILYQVKRHLPRVQPVWPAIRLSASAAALPQPAFPRPAASLPTCCGFAPLSAPDS